MNDMKQRVEETINKSKVVLVIKGTPDHPQCGFTQRIVKVLRKYEVEFSHFNIFDDPELMQAIKQYANWPTTPQLWVNGKFIGGCDIVESLDASGELEKILSPQ
jgi:monothiol glutaredoxin